MLTRSEIHDLAKKATRGVGYSWGMAEEAAMATLRLIVAGHDGFGILSAWLIKVDTAQGLPPARDCLLCQGAYLRDLDQLDGAADHPLIAGFADHPAPPVQAVPWPADRPEVLVRFAHRVYVPETAQSRARGAGGG